jgi:hypothetical protein
MPGTESATAAARYPGERYDGKLLPIPPPGWVVFPIAQVPGHRFGLRLAQQLIGQLLINQRPAGRLVIVALPGHLRSVLHRVSFREPQFLQLIVRPRHLHSR